MTHPDPRPSATIHPSEWLNRHGDSLYRFALSRLRNPDAAEEVVQETLVAAWGAREQYSGQGSEGAWLLGICKRKVVDYVRRRSRLDAAAGGEWDADPSANFFDSKGNWRFDPRFTRNRPEANLESEEFWRAFRGCLDGLPSRQSSVFVLRELDGLTCPEICHDMGITSSNLWVLLHRARLHLTRCMKRYLEQGEAS